ncbi:hypothetical protein Tco_1000458, partial [Tanacetum coccineum]
GLNALAKVGNHVNEELDCNHVHVGSDSINQLESIGLESSFNVLKNSVVNVGLESFPTVFEAHGIHPYTSTNEENMNDTCTKVGPTPPVILLCMTKSSTNKLFTPYKEPEQEIKSSRRHFKSLSLDELRSPDFNLFSDQEYSEEEEAEAIEETMEQYMSKTRMDYGSGVARPKIEEKDRRSTKTSDGLAAIQAQLNNLGREIKKLNEKVYTAQVGCEQCKGPHYTKDCPLKEEGKPLEEAYYTQFGGPFQGGSYRATAPGYYQRNNVNPSYQEQRKSMEDTLSKFMSESAKRHEENSNLIKEI